MSDDGIPRGVVQRLLDVSVSSVDLLRREGRSRVARVTLDGTGPASVITKRIMPDDGSPGWSDAAYANEVASLELLDGAGVTPRLLGADAETSTFIMEDLGTPPDTSEPYQRGTSADATAALMATATALARMHSASFGDEEQWLALRPSPRPPQRFPHADTLGLDGFTRALEAAGCDVDSAARGDMEAVEAQLADPGPFLALTHGDPCPDNILLIDGRAVIIDFEFAAFRHVLLDAVYPRMIFPTCWCANRVPLAVVREFEDHYRAGIAGACPAARDDREWSRALAVACAGRLIGSFDWLLPRALESNYDWGIATIRQRFVPRLQAFVDVAREKGELPALATLAERATDALRQRWSPEENELPFFPPLRA